MCPWKDATQKRPVKILLFHLKLIPSMKMPPNSKKDSKLEKGEELISRINMLKDSSGPFSIKTKSQGIHENRNK